MNRQAAQGALSKYQATSAQAAVEGASPHRLIDMLMERALSRIAMAKGHMQRGHIADKGTNISGAMAIIDGLRTFLDTDAGGEIALSLDNLYEYMSRRLLEANIGNKVAVLDEVANLLREIRSGWTAIAAQVETAVGVPA